MANQKEFKIVINGLTESIDNVGTLGESLDRLGKKVEESGDSVKKASSSMDELAKSNQKIAQYNKEYQTALESNKMVLADNAKEIKNKLDLEKAELIVSENQRGTYAEKQRLLTALGKVIKNSNTDTEESVQKNKELKAQYAELNKELKDFDAEMGNHQREVGNYEKATASLKSQVKDLQAEMANMLINGVDKADPKFVALAQKAGQLKDAMGDAAEEMNRFASDTKALDDVINVAQSATAAFTLFKGTMNAFGLETKGAEEALQELAGAMSIIQSLQTLSNTLQQGSATARLFHAALKLTGAELVVNQVNAIKATAANTALSASQKAATITTQTLSLAIKAIPLMFVIGLVATLITHWEDLVGWFEKTFPSVKKVGGAMNGLKAVCFGLGKAILNWVVNPLKTMADVISKIIKGDFSGAMSAVSEGIKNQFSGTAKAFKQGFQEQVERGLEEMSLKTLAETNKQTQFELNMLKARKGNQAKYSKEGIALQKKDFEERRKLARGNKDELNKIALEEANFFRECEEQKVKITKKATADRVAAAKISSKKAQDIQKEELDARKEAIEKFRKQVQLERESYAIEGERQTDITQEGIKQVERELDALSDGPLEKFKEKIDEWMIHMRNARGAVESTFESSLWDEYSKNVDQLGEHFQDLLSFATALEGKSIDWESWGLTEEQEQSMENIMHKWENFLAKNDEVDNDLVLEANKKIATAARNELTALSSDADKIFKELTEKVKQFNVEPKEKGGWIGKFLGLTDEEKTLKKLDYIKQYWVKAQEEIDAIVAKEEGKWDAYIGYVKELYGEDSRQYRKAVEEKMEALKKLWDMQEKVAQRASNPTSLSGDYNADGKPDANTRKRGKSPINGKEYKTDNDGKTNWNAFWDGEEDVFKNLQDLSEVFYENVFDPISEAFSALLEFQIEEAQEALDKATEMHDKSVEAVEASNQRLTDIKNEMTNASGAQLETLKQQQADEMLLLAQREAEEKRTAREKEKREAELAKKQKQQKKLELQMSLVEGIINTAVSVTKALTWGWPLGAIFASIIGAMGAVQTAIIAKQISKLADGGLLQGKSHAQGGIAVGNTGIEVEGGEYVINKRSTAKYLPLLQAINEEGARKKTVANQIGKYANGGQLNYERISSNMNSVDTNKIIQSSIEGIDMHPQVSVVDINRGQKNLTQVRQMAGGRS